MGRRQAEVVVGICGRSRWKLCKSHLKIATEADGSFCRERCGKWGLESEDNCCGKTTGSYGTKQLADLVDRRVGVVKEDRRESWWIDRGGH